jgi:DNA-binding NarL/FixJ family response regulator
MTTRTLALARAADTDRPGYAAFALAPRHDDGGARQRIGAGPVARALPVAVSTAANDSTMMMNVLNAYAFGVIICDQGGRVKFANAAAETLARQGGAILLSRGQLSALARTEACRLADLIRDAATDGAGGAIQLTGRDGAITMLALVTPLPRQPDQNHAGRALVSLRATADRLTLSATALAMMFGLTPSQASIALAIFEGKVPEKIALERGVRISTLRSHLAEIFARTGTEDQRDLVRLLGLLPPLAAAAATVRVAAGADQVNQIALCPRPRAPKNVSAIGSRR